MLPNNKYNSRGGFHKELRPALSPVRTSYLALKTVDIIGNCQRPVFSLGVSQYIHKITNLWKFELNRSSKLQDNNERKNTLVTRSCVLSDAWFWDLKFWNSWKITSFSKTTSLQRELFLTMFYTINLSPLLVTKNGFMLIIILSNYQ